MGGKRNGSHAKALEEISKDTWRYLHVKPRDIITLSKEQDLFYRGSRYLQPDIVAHTRDEVIIAEYKSTEEMALIEYGRQQVKKAMVFYETSFGVKTRGVLIIGDQVIESGDLSHFKKIFNKNKKSNHFHKKPRMNGHSIHP